MKIAFTAWEDRISPVFDSARRLLIVNMENMQIIGWQYVPFSPQPFFRLGNLLNALEIEVLICGAISQTPSNVIESSGVKLISFVGGKIDEILETYVKGHGIVPKYSMPGCGRHHRFKKRRRKGFLKENKG